jgi:hypothetical protein
VTWSDPRVAVQAPVRRALEGITLRGTLAFAFVAVAVACPTLPGLDPWFHELAHVAVPGFFVIAVAIGFVERQVRGRAMVTLLGSGPWERTRAEAWRRAQELAPEDTRLAMVLVAAVPVGVFGGLAALALPHLLRGDQVPEWVGLWAPALTILAILTSITWIEQCRDRIARAVASSNAELRAYWAGVANRQRSA